MALFGHGCLVLVLVLLAYATAAGAYAALRGRRRMLVSARNAVVASFAATALAAGTLVLAFVRNDFSLAYVATHSSRELPLGYTLCFVLQRGVSGLWWGLSAGLMICGVALVLVWERHTRFV